MNQRARQIEGLPQYSDRWIHQNGRIRKMPCRLFDLAHTRPILFLREGHKQGIGPVLNVLDVLNGGRRAVQRGAGTVADAILLAGEVVTIVERLKWNAMKKRMRNNDDGAADIRGNRLQQLPVQLTQVIPGCLL